MRRQVDAAALTSPPLETCPEAALGTDFSGKMSISRYAREVPGSGCCPGRSPGQGVDREAAASGARRCPRCARQIKMSEAVCRAVQAQAAGHRGIQRRVAVQLDLAMPGSPVFAQQAPGGEFGSRTTCHPESQNGWICRRLETQHVGPGQGVTGSSQAPEEVLYWLERRSEYSRGPACLGQAARARFLGVSVRW